jgi:catechol 2,3-dioxygenase-like lactoylglutathione lyase family enzyme
MQKLWHFHLSLNVGNLTRSIAFYRELFGLEPAKCHADYAKFEIADPPMVFSLVPHAAGPGPRSRLGLALASPEQVQAIRGRLESKGIHIDAHGESGFGVHDPDGNAWRIGSRNDETVWDVAPPAEELPVEVRSRGEPVIWEHYVTADLPERIPQDDGTVDEVRLTGTFNTAHAEAARCRLVADAFRVLKPGGKVVAHGLAGDKPFRNGMPALPGLAAMVSSVPTHQAILAALRDAGFVQLQFVKFGNRAWFEHDGVQMREIKAIGWKAPVRTEVSALEVIYRGPFRQTRDDQGNVYERGRRVAVPAAVWALLRQGTQAEHFVFVEPGQAAKTCQLS